MLEAVLRDGEDMSVLLPYEDIRRHVERLEPLLHRIRTPRLFLAYLSIEDGGEVDWAGGVFGDPLMSSWFDGKDEEGNGGLEDFDTVLDDPENAPSRMLLYRAYHTLVMIVMEYYRPTRESSRKELVWRKRLTGILGELEKVEVEGRGTEEPATPKRSSEVAGVGGGETPGKRVKTEEEKRIGEDVRSERESHSHGDKEDGSGDGEAESESDDESDEDYIPPFEDPTPPPG